MATNPINTTLSAMEDFTMFFFLLPIRIYDRYTQKMCNRRAKRLDLLASKARLVLPEVVGRERVLSICEEDNGACSNPMSPPTTTDDTLGDIIPSTKKEGPSINGNQAKHQRTYNQVGSRLLSLPPELRRMIWEYLLDHTVLIRREGTRKVYFDQEVGKYVAASQPGGTWVQSGRVEGCVFDDVEGNEMGRRGLGVLGLVGSCRIVYAEVIPLMYSLPTFHFADKITFLAFCCTILPQRRQQLRFLEFAFLSPKGSARVRTLENKVSYVPLQDLKALSMLPKRKVGDGKGETFRHVVGEVIAGMGRLEGSVVRRWEAYCRDAEGGRMDRDRSG